MLPSAFHMFGEGENSFLTQSQDLQQLPPALSSVLPLLSLRLCPTPFPQEGLQVPCIPRAKVKGTGEGQRMASPQRQSPQAGTLTVSSEAELIHFQHFYDISRSPAPQAALLCPFRKRFPSKPSEQTFKRSDKGKHQRERSFGRQRLKRKFVIKDTFQFLLHLHTDNSISFKKPNHSHH